MSCFTEEKDALNSIPRASAGYLAQTVDQLKGDFTKGTRKGLFGELKSWSDGRFPEDKPKRVYFLSGGAGLGKSAIAHQLCTRLNELQYPPQVGASYFFVKDDENLSSGHLFFSTLLHQLALSQPTLRPRVIAAVQEYLRWGDPQNIGYASKDLLRKVLLEVSASTYAPLFLVVDGLDECKERDLLPELLRSLLELVRELPQLRVFAASRPEPHIMAVLAAPEARDIVHSRSLDDTLEDLKGDVKLYLEEAVPTIPCYAAFLRDHPDAIERLSKRANGVFIYARIAVRFLDTYHDHPEEQFELLFSSEETSWLSPLDALYLQILRLAFPPAELRQAQLARRHRLLSLLQVIALREWPLKPGCIALLGSAMSEDDVAMMVGRLRSVLLVNKRAELTFLHATFGEFLLDRERCVDPLYHVDKATGHAGLASRCLAAFSFRNVTEFLANPDSALGEYVMYASLRWDEHLSHAKFNDELEGRLRTFVQSSRQVIYRRARLAAATKGPDLTTAEIIGSMDSFLRKVSNEPFPCTYWFFLSQVLLMRSFLQASRYTKEICSEFAKSTTYSISWYRQIAQYPDIPPDQLNLDLNTVAHELETLAEDVEWPQGGESPLTLDLNLQHSALERYQAAHAKLAKKVCRDERTKKLWFAMTSKGDGDGLGDGKREADRDQRDEREDRGDDDDDEDGDEECA